MLWQVIYKDVDVIFGGHSDHGLKEPVIHPKTGIVIGLTYGQGMHLGYTKFKIDTHKHNAEFLEGLSYTSELKRTPRE